MSKKKPHKDDHLEKLRELSKDLVKAAAKLESYRKEIDDDLADKYKMLDNTDNPEEEAQMLDLVETIQRDCTTLADITNTLDEAVDDLKDIIGD